MSSQPSNETDNDVMCPCLHWTFPLTAVVLLKLLVRHPIPSHPVHHIHYPLQMAPSLHSCLRCVIRNMTHINLSLCASLLSSANGTAQQHDPLLYIIFTHRRDK
mmetsp:Transcript_12906/g.21094  ORF Transcript_12906/g.21094 Transcript_12906/m.21094 type:complete len:104 (-) Transcript_12906:4319-4630(-)